MTKLSADKLKCNMCDKVFAYNKNSTTSPLMYYLRTQHTLVFETGMKSKSNQPSLLSFGVGPQRPCFETWQEKITALLVKVIVANMLPISLVENEEFCELMAFLEPNYSVPAWLTICKRLNSTKAEISKAVTTELQSSPAIHLTTDLFTNIVNDPYIGVTVSYITDDWELKARTLSNVAMEERHTQTNISAKLSEITATWQIPVTTKTVVHDGASNMKEVGGVNKWTDIGCSAHKLHLAVTGKCLFLF